MNHAAAHDGHAVSRLWFARHAATAPNLAGLRCGGDLDPPLAELGWEQAAALGRAVARLGQRIDLVVCADLRRTRETAAYVAHALGGVAIHVEPGLRERALGQWNLCPIDATQAALAAGQTPPGGEAAADFSARIAAAVQRLVPHLQRRHVLLIGSKGVGRVLLELSGLPPRAPLANAELIELPCPSPALAEPLTSPA